ncbi:MAG: MEDS domain-containing protein [Chitinophagales bacterium]
MRSGVEVIGNIPWGTHICQFYQDKQDLLEILVPYFAAGLAQNEACLWVACAPLGVEEARAALAGAVGDLDPYLRAGQLELLDYGQWYTAGGAFDANRVLQGWVQKLAAAQRRGFAGLRVSGNTLWLEQSTWRDYVEYETMVDRVIGRNAMLAICTYSLAKCGVPEIVDVMANHGCALIRRGGAWERIESAVRRKALESALTREKELAAERDQARIQLLHLLAHEIRNPMAGLKGLAQVVEQKTTDQEMRAIGGLMTREVDRLSHVLDGVLTAFRMQAGSLSLNVRTVDLTGVVETALNLYRSAGTHVYQVRLDRPATIAGDAVRLEDVVRNLLGNAQKYSAPGSTIHVELTIAGDHAVLSIRDHGVGIPADQLDRVFEVFFRATNVAFQHPEGTGLGLYLCKNIVEGHGGRIWAESEEGKGSAFHVELPLAASA